MPEEGVSEWPKDDIKTAASPCVLNKNVCPGDSRTNGIYVSISQNS